MRRLLVVTLLLLFATAAFAAEPIAPAPVAATSFPVGFASVATLNGRFLAQWRLDASIEQRIDGIPIDENGRRTTESARVCTSR